MQGLTLGQLCGLLCCPPCPSEIAAKLAFLPPNPTYSISIANDASLPYQVPTSSGNPSSPAHSDQAVVSQTGPARTSASLGNTASPSRWHSLLSASAGASDPRGSSPPVPGPDAPTLSRGGSGRARTHYSWSRNRTANGSLRHTDKANGQSQLKYRLHLSDRADWQHSQRELDMLEVFFARTVLGNSIAALHVRAHDRPRFTILFSHGNAVDLGQMASFFVVLALRTRCNILSYDYSGYGMSEGRPSERRMYADVECAYTALRVRYAVKPEQIVIYGQSIGTVPSVDLAARVECAGVVLHSPLTSGIRVACHGIRRTWCCDSFTSIEKVHRIAAPVLVIHGKEDEVIDISHGYEIYERLPNRVEPLWVDAAGHNDVEMYASYIERLNAFLEIDLPLLIASRADARMAEQQSRSSTARGKKGKASAPASTQATTQKNAPTQTKGASSAPVNALSAGKPSTAANPTAPSAKALPSENQSRSVLTQSNPNMLVTQEGVQSSVPNSSLPPSSTNHSSTSTTPFTSPGGSSTFKLLPQNTRARQTDNEKGALAEETGNAHLPEPEAETESESAGTQPIEPPSRSNSSDQRPTAAKTSIVQQSKKSTAASTSKLAIESDRAKPNPKASAAQAKRGESMQQLTTNTTGATATSGSGTGKLTKHTPAGNSSASGSVSGSTSHLPTAPPPPLTPSARVLRHQSEPPTSGLTEISSARTESPSVPQSRA